MLYEDPQVKRVLRALVARLSADPSCQEDLMQEALIHLWRLEKQRPGQQRAWYVQGCRYYLQNISRLGRSLDAFKRSQARRPAPLGEEQDLGDPSSIGDSLRSEVGAHDTISALTPALDQRRREILLCLADGLSAREIAKRLALSHTSVNAARREIADMAAKLGILPHGERPRAPGRG